MKNIENKVVDDFGNEWDKFNHITLNEEEIRSSYDQYFKIFPFDELKLDTEGFDMGCGSGRWASFVAPRVGHLNCIDPSSAIDVAKKTLSDCNNITFIRGSVSDNQLQKNSQDFGYSLGVLHHVPDTQKAIKSCVELLKVDAPLLLYLYYAFDNKPKWYKLIWKFSELVRKFVNKTPSNLKSIITNIIAVIIYFPLSRIAFFAEKIGFKVNNFPLSYYRDKSFYTMRTDSRDRFGTPLEKRFSREKIKEMMQLSSFENISFSGSKPYWVVLAYKK